MVRLVPMMESELEAYLEKSIPEYAAENVQLAIGLKQRRWSVPIRYIKIFYHTWLPCSFIKIGSTVYAGIEA